MDEEQKKTEDRESLESLEGDSSVAQQAGLSKPASESVKKSPNIASKIREKASRRWSVYLPMFVILTLALIVVTVLVYRHHSPTTPTLSQQNLTPSELDNLATSNQVVGSSNEVLTVQSSSIFNGQVLVRGQLQAASSIAANSLNIAGNSQFNQLQISKNLTVAGTATFLGGLTLQNGLSVNGDFSASGTGNFSGALNTPQLTTSTLQLNGDLSIKHHIKTSGSIPSHDTGSAVGSGGTTAINGSDTSGTVTINTGGSPSVGCYINVNFATNFSNTPHVLLTPIGSSSVGLEYYVNRTSSGFSVCSANAPQSAQSYTFDYFVID